MIRIIHVEDEEAWRFLIANKINRETDMKVEASVSTMEQCLEELERNEYDMALIDLNLSGEEFTEGVGIANEIQLLYPQIKIIIVTSLDEYQFMERSVIAGARHYITKKNIEHITSLIRIAYHNIDQPMQSLLQSFVVYKEQSYLDTFHLTQREKQIYQWKKDGLSNQEIAERHYLSLSTVRNQISSILHKIGTSTTTYAFNKIKKLLMGQNKE